MACIYVLSFPTLARGLMSVPTLGHVPNRFRPALTLCSPNDSLNCVVQDGPKVVATSSNRAVPPAGLPLPPSLPSPSLPSPSLSLSLPPPSLPLPHTHSEKIEMPCSPLPLLLLLLAPLAALAQWPQRFVTHPLPDRLMDGQVKNRFPDPGPISTQPTAEKTTRCDQHSI